MATAITDRRHLPDYAQATASRIELLGFRWRFLEDAHLADISRRVQVRDITALAPHNEVARYAQALKRGDLMPPVILTKDLYLVDGNTRTEAARKANWSYFPAFVLDEKFQEAPEALLKRFITLGAASNLTHGRGMSRENIAMVIAAVMTPGEPAKDVAAKLHIPVSTVSSVLNVQKAKDKLTSLGVDTSDESRLTPSHLRTIGGQLPRYTDPVLVKYAELIRDGQLTTTDARALGKRLTEAGTEEEKLDLILNERGARRDIISGQSSKPQPSAKLRQTLGFLLGSTPGDMIEFNHEMRSQHRRILYDAVDQLNKVIAAQEGMAG